MSFTKELEFAINFINSQYNKDEIFQFFATQEPPKNIGYLWWKHPILKQVDDGIACRGHSGGSFACTMRSLQNYSIELLEKKLDD